jgi:hypothetical protein
MQLLTPHAERCALFASNYKEGKRSFTELIDLVDFCIRDIINLTQLKKKTIISRGKAGLQRISNSL